MSKTKRILVLVAALVVIGGLVAGIAYWSLGLNLNQTERGLYLDGKQVENPGVVMTVGDTEIDMGVYRYYYLTAKYSLSGGDDSYWAHDPDGSRADYLRQTVDDYITYFVTWMTIADQYGIELDEEELAAIDETIAEQKELYGNTFQDVLDGFYLDDEETYYTINYMEQITQKAINEIYEVLAEEHRAELSGGIVSAQHILVRFADFEDDVDEGEAGDDENEVGEPEDADDTDDGTGEPEDVDVTDGDEEDAGEAPAGNSGAGLTAEQKALNLAQQLLDEIQASDDPLATFAALRAEYDADSASQPEEGYTFTEGDMVDSFYEGTLALGDNEISGLVESTYGYHIILRNPLDVAALTTEELLDVVESKVYTYVVEVRDAVEESLEITYGAYYESITPTTLK